VGVPPRRGVRVLREAETSADPLWQHCRAAALVLPASAAFSHETAAHLGGWSGPMRPEHARPLSPGRSTPVGTTVTHVSVPAGPTRPRAKGIRTHQVTWRDGDVMVRGGLRLTSPWRTWCDLGATGADEVDLLILADALRRRYPRDGAARLAARLEQWRGGRGVNRLRRVLALSRDGVDSPMETRVRLIFRAGGLPEPLVNHQIRLPHGGPLHRPDLCWPRWKVAADYDGGHHFERDSDAAVISGRASNWRIRQDQARAELLAQEGWTLRVFTAYDVFVDPDAAVMRMRDALIRAGARL